MTRWEIDPIQSTLNFTLPRWFGVSVTGNFSDVQGIIQYDPAHLAQTYLEALVNAASIQTHDIGGNLGRIWTMRNALNPIKPYPAITFYSLFVHPITQTQATIVGDLGLYGIKREITLHTSINLIHENQIDFRATATVNRALFTNSAQATQTPKPVHVEMVLRGTRVIEKESSLEKNQLTSELNGLSSVF